jgi:hypothetical protein
MFDSKIESHEARFEGNYSTLMLERAGSARISAQIVDLIVQANEYVRQNMGTFVKIDSEDGEHIFVKNIEGEDRYIGYTVKRLASLHSSRDQITAELEERIGKALSVTGVSFKDPTTGEYSDKEDKDGPWGNYLTNEMCLPIGFDFSPIVHGKVEEKEAQNRLKDMVVAHEKGHLIRPYGVEYGLRYKFYRMYFSKGFDFSKAVFSDEALKNCKTDNTEDESESIKKHIITYISSGAEIAERMSQLKNWLGFTSADIFTKQHLQLARERYLIETGLDNYMEVFLTAITPETEDNFIELINHSGI